MKSHKLICKYLNNPCSLSSRELEELEIGLKTKKVQVQFFDSIKINYLVNCCTKKFDSIQSEEKIITYIHQHKKHSFNQKVRRLLKYVAVLTFVLFTTYYLFYNNSNTTLGDEYITAIFEKETLEQIFEVIHKLHPIEYEINNHIINIK